MAFSLTEHTGNPYQQAFESRTPAENDLRRGLGWIAGKGSSPRGWLGTQWPAVIPGSKHSSEVIKQRAKLLPIPIVLPHFLTHSPAQLHWSLNPGPKAVEPFLHLFCVQSCPQMHLIRTMCKDSCCSKK